MTFICFALSLGLHILILLFPAPSRDTLTTQPFRVRRFPFFEKLRPFSPSQPDLPEHRLEPLPSPGFTQLPDFSATAQVPVTKLPTISLPSLTRPDTLVKPPSFHPPQLTMPDLNKLALEAAQKQAEEFEGYLRFFTFDADTSDEESRNRSKAREIVERAIIAMGGWEALLKIKEMHAKVWILAREHVTLSRGRMPGWVIQKPPYLFPVANWHYQELNTFSNRSIEVKISLDPQVPNKEYMLYNPAKSKGRYERLFKWHWYFLSARKRILREQGEAAYWHFISRFLREGVILRYVGTEYFKNIPVNVIQVDDRKHGNYYEALFERRTSLLLAIQEGLTPGERVWYRRKYNQLPPVWITIYHSYRPVQGVLTPHRMERWQAKGASGPGESGIMDIYLDIAYNDEKPKEGVPNLED